MSRTYDVFLSVARCANVKICLDSDVVHPCREIVESQGTSKYEDFQVPEPWVGEIERASILFVSSNPSIGEDRSAIGSSSDSDLWDSNNHAFGGGSRSYIVNGMHTTTSGGEQLKKIPYWVSVRARARELIPDAVPGRDYALTEIVHCKSTNEIGVVSAASECAKLHFSKVMEVSPASVVIVLGKTAREHLLGVGATIPKAIEKRTIGGLDRLVVYLPHPSSFEPGPRTIAGLFSDDIGRLRGAISKHVGGLAESSRWFK